MDARDLANGVPNALQTPGSSDRSRASSTGPGRGGIVVFSGGSAANSLVDVFNDVRDANRTSLSYIIPISDNGGSSSELIRVFGGPGKVTRQDRCHQ